MKMKNFLLPGAELALLPKILPLKGGFRYAALTLMIATARTTMRTSAKRAADIVA